MTPTSAEIKKLLKEKAPPSSPSEAVRDSLIVVLAEQVESLESSLSKLAKGLRAVAIVVGDMRGGEEESAEGAGAGGPAGQGQATGAPPDEAPGGGAPRDQTPFPTNLTAGGAAPFSQPGQKVTVQAPPDEGGGAPKPNVSSAQASNAQPIPKKQGPAAPQPNGKE